MKSSNEDKQASIGKLPAGRVPDPHSPTPPVQLWLPPWEEALKADGTPSGPAWRGQAIEFLLKASARCCSVTSQLSPVSN